MTGYLSDREGIISLWQEGFSDGRADVELFLDKLFCDENYFYIKQNGKILSQAFVVPVSLKGREEVFNGYYFCCAVTARGARGKGYMANIIERVKKTAEQRDMDFVALIPANRSLFDFYSKFGFERFFYCDEREVMPEATRDTDLDGGKILPISFCKTNDAQLLFDLQNEAFGLRGVPKNELSDHGFYEGTIIKSRAIFDYLVKDAALSGYEIYAVGQNGETLGFIFYDPACNLIREFMLPSGREDILSLFAKSVAGRSVTVREKANGFDSPKGMVYAINDRVKELGRSYPFINNLLES